MIKRIKFLIAAIVCLQMFVGCDIIVNKIEVEGSILGTWYCDETKETYIFYPDGRCFSMDDKSSAKYELTYSIEGGEVILYMEKIGEISRFNYNKGEDTFILRITVNEGGILKHNANTFVRQ